MPTTPVETRKKQYEMRDVSKDQARVAAAIASVQESRQLLLDASNRPGVKELVTASCQGQGVINWDWLPKILENDQTAASLLLAAQLGVGRSKKMADGLFSKQELEEKCGGNITSLHLAAIRSVCAMPEPTPKRRPAQGQRGAEGM